MSPVHASLELLHPQQELETSLPLPRCAFNTLTCPQHRLHHGVLLPEIGFLLSFSEIPIYTFAFPFCDLYLYHLAHILGWCPARRKSKERREQARRVLPPTRGQRCATRRLVEPSLYQANPAGSGSQPFSNSTLNLPKSQAPHLQSHRLECGKKPFPNTVQIAGEII